MLVTRVWQKWRFSAPQIHLWLKRAQFSASTFMVKIATFAKPATVSGNGRATLQTRKVSAKNGLTKSQRSSKIKRAASHAQADTNCSTFYFAPTHHDSSDIVNNFMWTFIVHKNIIPTFGQKLS